MNLQEAKKLEKKVETILDNYLKKNNTVIVGVSGGPDSIFLLKFLAEMPIKVIAAHLNHNLRKESKNEENFVKTFVDRINLNSISEQIFSTEVSFISKSVDIKKNSKNSKKGIEETGRIERYKFFKYLAKKYHAKYIVTAHHADDNLETILLNLTRGATLKGLSGMEILDQNLFRPLLSITKKQISDYLKYKKIPFVTDKSNFSTKYKRNAIRNLVIPELTKLNTNIAQTVAANTQNLKEIQNFLTKQAQKWLKKNSNSSIPTKTFIRLHTCLQKEILRELYKIHVGHTENLENVHIEEALDLITKNIGNKEKKFGKLRLTLKNNTLTIKKL